MDDVLIITSPRRKRPAISVKEGKTVLHLPEGFPRELAQRLIEENRPAIENLRRREARMPEAVKPDFRMGAKMPMLGEFYPVMQKGAGMPEFREGAFMVTAGEGIRLRNQILYIYRNMAAEIISRKLFALSNRHRISYRSMNINSADTRWGSCSGEGVLNFSWKLILTPEPMVDYVVAHELAHRKEMNHSRKFWQEVEKLCPNFRTWRHALKEQAQIYRLWQNLK